MGVIATLSTDEVTVVPEVLHLPLAIEIPKTASPIVSTPLTITSTQDVVSATPTLEASATTDKDGNTTSVLGSTTIVVDAQGTSKSSDLVSGLKTTTNKVFGISIIEQGATKISSQSMPGSAALPLIITEDTSTGVTKAVQGLVSTTLDTTTGLKTSVDSKVGITTVENLSKNIVTSTDSIGNTTIRDTISGKLTVTDVVVNKTVVLDPLGKTPVASAVASKASPAASTITAANVAAKAASTAQTQSVLKFVLKYAPTAMTIVKNVPKISATLIAIEGSILVTLRADPKSILGKSNTLASKASGEAKKAGNAMAKKAQTAAKAVFAKIMSLVGSAYKTMLSKIKAAAAREKAKILKQWSELKKAYRALIDKAKATWDAISKLFKSTSKLLKAQWDSMENTKITIPAGPTATIKDKITMIGKISKSVSEKAQKISSLVKAVMKAKEDFTKAMTALTSLAGAVLKLISDVTRLAMQVVSSAMTMAAVVASAGAGFVASLPGAVLSGLAAGVKSATGQSVTGTSFAAGIGTAAGTTALSGASPTSGISMVEKTNAIFDEAASLPQPSDPTTREEANTILVTLKNVAAKVNAAWTAFSDQYQAEEVGSVGGISWKEYNAALDKRSSVGRLLAKYYTPSALFLKNNPVVATTAPAPTPPLKYSLSYDPEALSGLTPDERAFWDAAAVARCTLTNDQYISWLATMREKATTKPPGYGVSLEKVIALITEFTVTSS